MPSHTLAFVFITCLWWPSQFGTDHSHGTSTFPYPLMGFDFAFIVSLLGFLWTLSSGFLTVPNLEDRFPSYYGFSQTEKWNSCSFCRRRPLLCQPGFVAIYQLPSMASKTFKVPSLSRSCGHEDEDRLLCPFRALKFYISRVKSIRYSRKILFITLKRGGGDVSSASILVG